MVKTQNLYKREMALNREEVNTSGNETARVGGMNTVTLNLTAAVIAFQLIRRLSFVPCLIVY